METSLIIVGAIAFLVAILLLIPVFLKARDVNLTESYDEQPEWMNSTPPSETLAATKEDGEGYQVFDHDEGEKLAAPFAEQIEDIIQAKLKSDPYLNQFEIDLGTSPDGGLEIWVNGKAYQDVNSLPDERLIQAFQDAIKQWNK